EPGIKASFLLGAKLADGFHHHQENFGNNIFYQVWTPQPRQYIAIDNGECALVKIYQRFLIMTASLPDHLRKSSR
ncbi:MAG TPA: hypothetical protein VKT25_07790, partial [Ktedonobacteraceae bacterium]|nr:hypothetical protein [Ktedonobacteraceae bacterium]